MRCGLVCLLASVLTVGAFACALPMNMKAIEDLRILLDEKQIAILDDIAAERARLSFEGLLLGLVAVIPLVLLLNAWCSAALILFITQATYYHVSPKKNWMLNHLKTNEQVDAWLVIYKKMQFSGIVTSLGAAMVYLVISLTLKP
tara:strand:- start:54 stop:488 length:435 start_codon:yes stop_codon:yes gene_type:complete